MVQARFPDFQALSAHPVTRDIFFHPFHYAKVLIQIGHEPLQPFKSRSLLGKEQLYYPNIFYYIRHIIHRDGLLGCFRGLVPNVATNVVYSLAYRKSVKHMQLAEYGGRRSAREHHQIFVKLLLRDAVATCAAIVASQPLRVLTVHAMAEFVGGSGGYTSAAIYAQHGLAGFFAGVVPQVMTTLVQMWGVDLCMYSLTLMSLVYEFELGLKFINFVELVRSMVVERTGAVSCCMAVTGSWLPAGNPPHMPVYRSLLQCYRDMQQYGRLRKGFNLVWRRPYAPMAAIAPSVG